MLPIPVSEMGYGWINVDGALWFARDNSTAHKLERVSRDSALVVQILFGLTPGGQPVRVDPDRQHRTPQKRHVLLGLAITELAGEVNDPGVCQAHERVAGRRSNGRRDKSGTPSGAGLASERSHLAAS